MGYQFFFMVAGRVPELPVLEITKLLVAGTFIGVSCSYLFACSIAKKFAKRRVDASNILYRYDKPESKAAAIQEFGATMGAAAGLCCLIPLSYALVCLFQGREDSVFMDLFLLLPQLYLAGVVTASLAFFMRGCRIWHRNFAGLKGPDDIEAEVDTAQKHPVVRLDQH